MTQALIRAALESRLAAWATAQSRRVAYENAEFVPATAETYVRAFVLPALTQSADIGRLNRRFEGILQCNIIAPEGTGPGAVEALFATLEAQFQPQTPITYGGLVVWLTQPMSLGPQIPEPGRYMRPASVPYAVDRY